MKDTSTKLILSFILACFLCFFRTIDFAIPVQFPVAFLFSYLLIEVVSLLETFSFHSIYTDTYLKLKQIEEKLLKNKKYNDYCIFSIYMQIVFDWLKQDVLESPLFSGFNIDIDVVINDLLDTYWMHHNKKIIHVLNDEISEDRMMELNKIFGKNYSKFKESLNTKFAALKNHQIYKRRKVFMECLVQYVTDIYSEVQLLG